MLYIQCLCLHDRIKDLIEGGHEPSSFLHWQEKMREKMLQEEMDKSERKHLEGYVSHDRAAVARIRMMERNHKAVQTIKEGVGDPWTGSRRIRETVAIL